MTDGSVDRRSRGIVPIFLLSMPRSGSTLAQRVIAAHPNVSTTAEPWVLLPHAYALRERGVAAEYTQPVAARAIREFVDRLEGGEDAYFAALRRFALDLYERAAEPGATYFLDKTPRYHYILPELFRTFPEARYVFLWRDPLAVVGSICDTWTRGRWTVDRWKGDLDGIVDLVDAYVAHRDTTLAVTFERLVREPEPAWKDVFDYLDLPFDPAVLTSFSQVRLAGSMGDPTGVRRYDRLSTEPLEKWKRQLRSPWRKGWCRSWLHRIGEERLATMGYDLDTLLRALDEVPTAPLQTAADAAYGSYWWWAQRRKRAAFRRMAPRVR